MTQAAPAIANPFPGLRPFRENEEHLFFGREGQIDTMINKLAAHKFLAVLGMSGSGKSSLVNCGLRPALHRGLMAHAGTSWRIAQFRPGRNPIGSLAEALSADDLLFPAARPGRLPVRQMVEDTLRMSNLGLIDTVRQARLDEHTNVLIVADQFEELFRFRQSADRASSATVEESTAFVNLLLQALSRADQRIYVVLTMRSDFLGDCAQFAELPEAINRGQYLVPRLTREERRAAIAGPIAVGGGRISPVLLTRLINDVGDNPDQLSILQHALNRTWAYWAHRTDREGPLSLEHYEAIGMMAGALDMHAEKAFAELITDRQRKVCEEIFETLTDMGTDARGIRRPTQFQTLCAIANADPDEVAAVIDIFRKPSRSFLMPPLNEKLAPETVVDLSHESLMRLWKRLDRWAHEEAESAQLYRRLADASRRHQKGQTALWVDPDLQAALDWRERYPPTEAWANLYGGGFDVAMSFLNASEAERSRRQAMEKELQERELEQARKLAEAQAKSARLLRLGMKGAIFAVLVCIGLIAWAISERDTARHVQAGSLVDQLATDETPPSPSDVAPLWALYRADDQVRRNVLEYLLTNNSAKRKASTRSYALRRSLIGFGGRHDALVKKALAYRCTNDAMLQDLYLTGVCIALGRGFYPVDAGTVLNYEKILQARWEDWGKDDGRYPALQEKKFRDVVAGNFLNLIHSLGPEGAAVVAKSWLTDLALNEPWKEHMLAAWTKAVENMNPSQADDVAKTLFASPQFEAIRSEDTPAVNALTVLANAASDDVKRQIWDRLLNVLDRNSKEVWLNAQQPPARIPEPVFAENRFDQNHPFTTDEKIRAEINRRAGVITARIRSITNVTQRAALEGLHGKVKNRNNDQVFAELRANRELAKTVDEYQKLTGPEVFPLLEMAPSLLSDQRPALKAVASYMRQESRALLETGAFSSFVDVLTTLQSDKDSRAAVLNELLHISEADRSRAVCYLLDPNDPTSSAMRRLLTAWGEDAAKTAVQNVLQWPDCPPNAVFAVVRALADLKGEPRKSLGDRRGLVVMEQFANWARQHGYAFPAVKPPEEDGGPEPVTSKLSLLVRPSKTL